MNTGKSQAKHGEFYLDRSVATLLLLVVIPVRSGELAHKRSMTCLGELAGKSQSRDL